MNAYRFAYRRALDLGRWLIIALTVFGLGACGTIGPGTPQTIAAKLPTAFATPRSTATATSTLAFTPSAINAWTTYRNDRAGYAIDYPTTWKVDERTDPDGAVVTTFSPDSDQAGMSVTVIVREGEPADGDIPDMPNTRCQPVTVGRLSGRRCMDTLAPSVSTTLLGQGKQYSIEASGKRLDQDVYQRFLDSFTVTA